MNIAIYSSNNSIFKNPFDIHSSINSIILYVACLYIGTLQHNTLNIPAHHIANYNRYYNCLQRLCQHFLKASSLLHVYVQSKKYHYYLRPHDNVYSD